MDDMTTFERRFEDRVRAFGRAGVRPVDSAAVARAVAVSHPRNVRAKTAVRWLGFAFDRRGWAIVLALGLLVILLGGALLVGSSLIPSLLDARIPVRPSPSPRAVVGPTSTPTAEPSPTPTPAPIVWTEASLIEDWPAPVRAEPAGGAIVQVIPSTIVDGEPRQVFVDPSGDTGSDAHPWVDIQELSGFTGFGLASNQPPLVDPADQWIAYGVVFDFDRDGVADWRYGIDNSPVPATGERAHRAWRTDLHTGRTESSEGGRYVFDSFYPPGYRFDAYWGVGGADLTGGGRSEGVGEPNYYLWASVIQNGRVVATDYAPDVGWLDPSELGRGPNLATPFGPNSDAHTVCVVPPQRGCRETDGDDATRIFFTVPDGWALSAEHRLSKPATGSAAPRGMSLQFLRGGWLFSDPCRTDDSPPDIRVGYGADEFAEALAAHPLLDVTTPVDITLGGYAGKYVDLRVPADVSGCGIGYSPWAPAYQSPGPNARWHIWILDGGSEGGGRDPVRIVIVSEDYPGTSAEDVAEMRAIIETIRIEGVPAGPI
jgi:hypothetical protein